MSIYIHSWLKLCALCVRQPPDEKHIGCSMLSFIRAFRVIRMPKKLLPRLFLVPGRGLTSNIHGLGCSIKSIP